MFQLFQWLRRGGGHEQSNKSPTTPPTSASLFPTSCVCGSLPNNNNNNAEDLIFTMHQQQQSGASTPTWQTTPIPRGHIIKPRQPSGTTTPTTTTPRRLLHMSSKSGASTPRQHGKPAVAPNHKPDVSLGHANRDEDSKAGPTTCSRNGSLSSSSSSSNTSNSTSSTLLKRSGSIPFADSSAVKSVPEESPPPLSRHARWLKMGMSRSGKASPNRGSISSLPDWNNINNNDVEILVNEGEAARTLIQHGQRAGTLSTMGSPWNSKAGHSSSYSFDHQSTEGVESRHQLYHSSYRRRRKYKQGHWVTTDTDYVVLEL